MTLKQKPISPCSMHTHWQEIEPKPSILHIVSQIFCNSTCGDESPYLCGQKFLPIGKKSALWGRNFQPIGTILYNMGSEKILLRWFLIKIENEPHNSRSFPFILKGEANDFERNLSGLQQNALSIILVLEWNLLKAVQCRRVIKTCYSKQRSYF